MNSFWKVVIFFAVEDSDVVKTEILFVVVDVAMGTRLWGAVCVAMAVWAAHENGKAATLRAQHYLTLHEPQKIDILFHKEKKIKEKIPLLKKLQSMSLRRK